MEVGNKRGVESDISGDSSGKRARPPDTSDDVGNYIDDIMTWLSGDEETVSELMNLLDEKDDTSPPVVKVKFIDDPYSSPSIFQSSSSSYITINGNEETCGSSFSFSDSSVMASVDMSGIIFKNIQSEAVDIGTLLGLPEAKNGGACGEDEEVVARYLVASEDDDDGSISGINGSDFFDWDDNLLASFLGEDLPT